MSNVTVSTTLKNQPIDEALRQWNFARTAFAAALQTYLDTFSHFELVCSQRFDPKEHDIARPGVRAAIDDEALSLAPRESAIISIGRKLLQLRNMSRSTSPVAALPTEVLSRIFVFTIELCRVGDAGLPCPALWVHQVNAISGVCSHWRSTALSTRRLWTCIDFGQLDHTKYLDLWLDRAGSYPLDVAHVARSEHDEDRDSRFSSVLHRINHTRSIVLRSKAPLMQNWIWQWYTNGAPRSLTTLALATPWQAAEFPPQTDSTGQQRLEELFYSLDTLYLSEIRVNWNSLRCHSLVTLSLEGLRIGADALRNILTANPDIQYIQLLYLDVAHTPTSSALPLIPLPQLCTLIQESFSCVLLPLIAPGNQSLTFKMGYSSYHLSDAARHNFIEFCKRSHITELHCRSSYVLQDAVSAESKVEILCFENMTVDNFIYNLIVPPTNNDSSLPPEQPQPRLPYLHSIYFIDSTLENPEGLRRVVSACSIREVGINQSCTVEGNSLSGIRDLEDWVGPGINTSFVINETEGEYEPFDS
ncbi:hypothetical protein BDV93DRAFT_311689 [Ceratobasidium sp. AG-I]|nr:hypothetical protein BDV93DRAFT_311689 [Ceratobasidium sp. AG-I]